MTVGSLFSGIGGFDLGMQLAGREVRFQVEIDPFCRRVLARHWPDVRRYEDVTQINGADLEPVDVMVGGFPCQDLSIAGKRGGLNGARSGLFYQFTRIAQENGAPWVVIENVDGLLSSDMGSDFAAVLAELADVGYVGAWRVLDSQWFGVPQRRNRVFLVGHRGTDSSGPAAVLFESAGGGWDSPACGQAGADVAATLRGRSHGAGVNAPGRGGEDDVNLIACSDSGQGWWNLGIGPLRAEGENRPSRPSTLIAFDTTQITSRHNRSHPRAGDPCHSLSASAHAPAIAGPLGGGNDGIVRRSEDDPNLVLVGSSGERARALTASMHKRHDEDTDTLIVARPLKSGGNDRHDESHETYVVATLNSGGNTGGFRTEPGEHLAVFPGGVRRLTPLECERLQNFPDGWTCLCGVQPYITRTCRCPDSPRYRALGNAVTVSVVEWIARRLHSVVSA